MSIHPFALLTAAFVMTACGSAEPEDTGTDLVSVDILQVDVAEVISSVDVGEDVGSTQIDTQASPVDTQFPPTDTQSPPEHECTVNEDCVESQGVPVAPATPCGNCYAVCEENVCGTVCYEAMDCIFTAGCGPNCEPLCNTTEDCFEALGQVCIDGICQDSSEPEPGTVMDIEGQVYPTVQIGAQVWMAKNLNTNTPDSFYYGDDPSNGAVYGRLYTQDAAMTACMAGWHLPTDEEWMALEIFLGMSEEQVNIDWTVSEFRGTDEGGKLKEVGTELWEAPNDGATNETGFSARPGGFGGYGGGFDGQGRDARFWSTTVSRYLRWDRPHINRYVAGPLYQFSVRCVQD